MRYSWNNVFLEAHDLVNEIDMILDEKLSVVCLPYALKLGYDERTMYYESIRKWITTIVPRLVVGRDTEISAFESTICSDELRELLLPIARKLIERFYGVVGKNENEISVKYMGMTSDGRFMFFYREKEPMEK